MLRKSAAIITGLACLWIGWTAVQGEPASSKVQKDATQSALMRAKLASTQKIVEGLVSKDFGDISKGAEELLKICKGEDWKSHEDDIYGHHRRELMLQSEKIMNAAARENLDGAAYSYIHALTTCISCHDYCRDVLKIAQDDHDGRIVPIPTSDEAVVPRTSRR